EMAVRDGSRLKSLVLVGPAGISVPGVKPGDVFLWSPEELARNLFFDPALAEKMLAQPMTPELLDESLKNRHTVARLGWEPRMHDPFLRKWLHRVNVPVKIVWGEADKYLPVRYLGEVEQGEELGFDAIAVNEHHQTAYGLMPSPIVTASALARRTKRAKIAILGSALPLREHPLMVAEEHAMIDVISGGRLISG